MKTFDYKFDDLINPCLQAFHALGGSATNAEIEEKVIGFLNLTDDQVNDIHRGNDTKLNYRLRWARNYLKRAGILENSARGVWALTEKGQRLNEVDQRRILREISSLDKKNTTQGLELIEDEEQVAEVTWHEELLNIIKEIPPDAFERLSQRLLRELGFKNVEVTGRSGDGGIDGKGILNIGSVITFRVVFQCKRYKGTVSSSVVRDFRGAMQGRADKGLLITTGSFSRDAKAEAQRDGALAIDLIDGNELAQRLKDLNLGISVELVEKVTVETKWFWKI